MTAPHNRSKKMKKKKLNVSFSGGETSAFMAQWLWQNKRDEYDMLFLFANTGAYIERYGMPNPANASCTREMKVNPMRSARDELGFDDAPTAIGIRADEFDRMSKDAKKFNLIYPLISSKFCPMTKPDINLFWAAQPFRLKIPSYLGNCVTCFKKADRNLFAVAKDSEKHFDFFKQMEKKFTGYVPASRQAYREKRGNAFEGPTYFFRNKRNCADILKAAREFDGLPAVDQRKLGLPYDDESCEVFTECGADN
jgi:hypothetical protein